MANNNRIQLNRTESELLCFAAADLISILQIEEPHVSSVKQLAFDYFDQESNKTFQVQVKVTRDEREFIPVLTTETISNYGGK